MVVPDALSRAIESVELVNMAKTNDDAYIALRADIQQNANNYVDYRSDNDIILKHVGYPYTGDDDEWRIIVPKDFRNEVHKTCHDDTLAVHGGYLKTLHRMQRPYF